MDAKQLRKCLAGTPGDDTATEVTSQIAFADTVLLSKIDLVAADELSAAEAAVRDINPVAQLIHAQLDTDDCPQWLSRVRPRTVPCQDAQRCLCAKLRLTPCTRHGDPLCTFARHGHV